jgi:hypothetical protein
MAERTVDLRDAMNAMRKRSPESTSMFRSEAAEYAVSAVR